MPAVKHTEFTINERRAIETAANRPDLTGYGAISKAAGLSGAYVSLRCKRNPKFREALEAALARRTEKVIEKTAKEVCKFDALKELADIAQSWRESKYGVGPAHVRAAELYVHISGQTPEAKKIMADIYGKMNASEFYGWNQDELDTYVRTGERPARLSPQSGSSSVN